MDVSGRVETAGWRVVGIGEVDLAGWSEEGCEDGDGAWRNLEVWGLSCDRKGGSWLVGSEEWVVVGGAVLGGVWSRCGEVEGEVEREETVMVDWEGGDTA